MSFIPGLILGVILTMFKDEIVQEAKLFYHWVRRIYYYQRLKLRIVNKNDLHKKDLLYYYKNNLLTLKQYNRLVVLRRNTRNLKLIVGSATRPKASKESVHMMQ